MSRTQSFRVPSRRGWAIAGAVAAVVAGSVAIAGCGNSVPADAVATVGGTVITKAQFNHWISSAAKQSAQQSGSPSAAIVPDPPNYDKCIAAMELTASAPGSPKPNRSTLKQQCEQEYDSLRDQTMQFLISAQWLMQEAKLRHVTVSDTAVNASFEQQKKQAFPKQSQYEAFLQSTGQTQDDLVFRVRLSLLTNALQEEIVKTAKPVSQADIADYYARNKGRFAQPESLNLLVVLNSNQAKAKQARNAIQSGQSWAQVAKQYSTDPSKAQGGKLLGVTRGQQERDFETAIFAAPQGVLEGPVKTQFGYYVFKVTKITPAHQQTLAQASATISSLLRSQRQQAALNSFVKEFQKRHQAQTQCQSGYEIAQECANGPSSTPTTSASGSAPQGGGASGGAATTPAPSTGATPGGATPGAPQGATPPSSGAPQGAPPSTGP